MPDARHSPAYNPPEGIRSMHHIEVAAVTERLNSIRSDLRTENGEVSPTDIAYALGQLHALLSLDLITNDQYEELYALAKPARSSLHPH